MSHKEGVCAVQADRTWQDWQGRREAAGSRGAFADHVLYVRRSLGCFSTFPMRKKVDSMGTEKIVARKMKSCVIYENTR